MRVRRTGIKFHSRSTVENYSALPVDPCLGAGPSASAMRRPGPVPKIGRLDGTGCPWQDPSK
eukprot:scaffold8133_cov31-Phaeocystis_antarctica.AAC.1